MFAKNVKHSGILIHEMMSQVWEQNMWLKADSDLSIKWFITTKHHFFPFFFIMLQFIQSFIPSYESYHSNHMSMESEFYKMNLFTLISQSLYFHPVLSITCHIGTKSKFCHKTNCNIIHGGRDFQQILWEVKECYPE